MSVEVRRDAVVFEELASWWNAQPGPSASLYLRSEWFGALAAALGQRLHVAVASDGGRPVAALPLMKARWGLRSLAVAESDVFDLVHDGSEAGIEAIRRHLRSVRMLRLHALPHDSVLLDGRHDDPRWTCTKAAETAVVPLSDSRDALAEALGRSLRSNVRRGWRALEDLGEVRLVLRPTGPEARRLLDEGLALEASGWKATEGQPALLHPDQRSVVEAIVETAVDRDWLALGGLYLDDRLVAFNLDVAYASQVFGLITAHDEGLPARCSPGSVLLWRTLEDAIDRGERSYELGGAGGRNAWKRRWPVDLQKRTYWTAFGTGPIATAARIVWQRRNRGIVGS